MSTSTARAIVATAPGADFTPGSNWSLQTITVPTDLKEGELLVEMVATGICHTDLLTTSFPDGIPGIQYPRVVGHEGSGYVKAVGPGVTKDVKVGDPVLLSFDHCGGCESCERGHPAFCVHFNNMNIPARPDIFSLDGKPVAGKSFGQSSFSSLSVVNQASVLPARDLVKSKEELQLFAPLGCGIQTGAGAILNMAKAEKRDRVMILGLGGVGLAAIMAAKVAGCKQIVGVDRVDSRIELAKTLGATDGCTTNGLKEEDMTAKFKEITGGLGPTIVVDTTAFLPLMKAGLDSVAPTGAFVFVGASIDPNFKIELGITQHTLNGTRIIGCIEGDALPAEFIPKMIQWQRDGQFKLEKLAKFYKLDDFEKALHDMHTGETIKPILLF